MCTLPHSIFRPLYLRHKYSSFSVLSIQGSDKRVWSTFSSGEPLHSSFCSCPNKWNLTFLLRNIRQSPLRKPRSPLFLATRVVGHEDVVYRLFCLGLRENSPRSSRAPPLRTVSGPGGVGSVSFRTTGPFRSVGDGVQTTGPPPSGCVSRRRRYK